MQTYYIKKGRKYIPVAESVVWDSVPYGSHLVTVEQGCTSWKYNIEPNMADVEAAINIVEKEMIGKMLEQRIGNIKQQSYPVRLREKVKQAFETWKNTIGEDLEIIFDGSSIYETVKAGLDVARKHIKQNRN